MSAYSSSQLLVLAGAFGQQSCLHVGRCCNVIIYDIRVFREYGDVMLPTKALLHRIRIK